MAILTHTLSGIAVGTVMATFSKGKTKSKLFIAATGGLGGIFPDLDVISLWSGFDKTIGKIFNLSHNGRDIFSEQFWYSHHGILHSVTGILFVASIISVLFFIISKNLKPSSLHKHNHFFNSHILYFIAFFSGAIIHIIEDMPTPGGPWGGVMLFFPYTKHFGGTGNIWWWNNYDIFIVALTVVFINITLLLIYNKSRPAIRHITVLILFVGISIVYHQINIRSYNFNKKDGINREEVSKEIQRRILGDEIYNMMIKFDNMIKVNF
ncbi:MAG: metal-dependent hydrolase [Chlorobi bacterium]|nr:metal-dependent hydrolase [Chlorobiota bacterium]